jgi:hypothetical protein
VPGGLLRVVLEACNVDVMLWPLVAGVVASSAVGGDEIRLDRQDKPRRSSFYAAHSCHISIDKMVGNVSDVWHKAVLGRGRMKCCCNGF